MNTANTASDGTRNEISQQCLLFFFLIQSDFTSIKGQVSHVPGGYRSIYCKQLYFSRLLYCQQLVDGILLPHALFCRHLPAQNLVPHV